MDGRSPTSTRLPQEQLDFRDTIRQIAQERVAPRAAEIDEKAEYPQDIRELFAEHDLFGLPFEEEHGGTGTGALMLNMAIEEIAKACASQRADADGPGARHAADQAVRHRGAQGRASCRVRDGRVDAGVRAVASPRRARTPAAMITRAVRDGDEWVINGTKNWITNLGDRRLLRRLRGHRPGGRPLRAASARSSSRPTGPASASASSSTSWASAARRPASRSSTTSASRPRT